MVNFVTRDWANCYRGTAQSGVLKMRLILDRFSAEIFLNDGEQVMTANLYTDPSADGISFLSEGAVSMNRFVHPGNRLDLARDRREFIELNKQA